MASAVPESSFRVENINKCRASGRIYTVVSRTARRKDENKVSRQAGFLCSPHSSLRDVNEKADTEAHREYACRCTIGNAVAIRGSVCPQLQQLLSGDR